MALAFSSTYPATTTNAEADIQLFGTVVGVNGQRLRNAEVTLTLVDTYYVAYTNDKDKYSFRFASDAAERFTELRVEKDDYQIRRLTGFTQLPREIRLDVIRSPLPLSIDSGDYVQMSSIKLHQSPRDDSLIVTELSKHRLLQVIGGPHPQGTLQWWRVRLIDDDEQAGWIMAASPVDRYMGKLPHVFVGRQLRMIHNGNLSVRATPNIHDALIDELVKGTMVLVIDGPTEANGYL